jgi:hypothetical protein
MNFSEIYNIIFTEIPSFFPEVLIYVGRRTDLLKLKFKNVKKCTMLKYKFFTIKAMEPRHVSTVSCGSSSERFHTYLCNT